MDSLPIHMYYNTALRNIGLYTSLSLALLAGSRFFLGKGNEKAADQAAVNAMREFLNNLQHGNVNEEDWKYINSR